jgi:hypothetical protein
MSLIFKLAKILNKKNMKNKLKNQIYKVINLTNPSSNKKNKIKKNQKM